MKKKIKKTDVLNDAITYEKIQKATADNVILGNVSGADSDIVELTAAQAATLVGSELLIDEDDFASNSDTKAPTQQSTKAYVDNATAQDVVLLETQTASSSATIDFTSLSTDYRTFKIVYDSVVPATDGSQLYIRTSTDGGSTFDNGSSDYQYVRHLAVTTSSSAFAATTTHIVATGGGVGSGTGESANGEVTLFNPSGTSYTYIQATASYMDNLGRPDWSSTAGFRAASEDVDAIQFLFASGNIASGTFKLYGYK